jgi:AIPR protein/uncharacterized protein DUF4357
MARAPLHPSQSLALRQLARAIDTRFVSDVHQGGMRGAPPSEDQLRSRGFAGMAAHMVSGIPDAEAAKRVTDYFNDDGIDGFAIAGAHSLTPTVYLVQAKWSASGVHTYKVGEVRELFAGFKKLIGRVLHPDNLLRDHLHEIDPLLDGKTSTRFVLIFASSGVNPVSSNTRIEADQEVEPLLEKEIEVSYRFLSLTDFADEVWRGAGRDRGVQVRGSVAYDSRIREDHLSLQGTINAAELGDWYLKHQERLLDDNVRTAIEGSDVNDEIVRCLLEEPENFWYFHVGVTALCNKWKRVGNDKGPVLHDFYGLRIVNGAQTVDSIGRALDVDRAAVEKAQVPIRFVRLDHAPVGFGARVARATNRSNQMTARDLVAMDHAQQRLRDEFALTWGMDYAIRTNDPIPTREKGCSVQEAMIAMACARHEASELMKVAQDTASLWATRDPAYRMLFGEEVTAVEVWRRVQTLRLVTEALDQVAAAPTERSKSVAVRGRLIITYMVMRRLGDDRIDDIASDWDNRLANVPGHVYAAVLDLSGGVRRRLTEKGLPSGKGVVHVTSVLRDGNWLAPEVERILTPGGSASPERTVPWAAWPSAPEFRLTIGTMHAARGRRCDDGFLVSTDSMAGLEDKSSLRTSELLIRRNLRDSLGLVPSGGYLRLTRDALFESPSQAAAIMIGHSTNGPDYWVGPDGRSYNERFPTR